MAGAALLLGSGAAQEPKFPFEAGETLHYTVKWKLIPAGNAELTVFPDHSAPGLWKITGRATSFGYVSNLYKVDDLYQAGFHNPTFCSSGIQKTIREGDRRHEMKLAFDLRQHTALLETHDLSSGVPPSIQRFAVPDCVHDILSALYFARTQPMAPGKSFELSINDGGKTVPIRVDVQREEDITTAAGKFRAVRVEPDVFSSHLFSGKGRLQVWFSKDPQHLPVQIRAQIGVGTIVATLTKVENGAKPSASSPPLN